MADSGKDDERGAAEAALLASTDGKTVTLAPLDKGAWWERWADISTWRKETEPLPGDSAAPEALLAAAAKEWIDKRKKIVDGNADHHAKNDTLRNDPEIAKKLKKGLGLPFPALPDASLGDAEYNKQIQKPGYNWWVTNANYVIRGGSSKFEFLDDLGGAHSTVEQSWLDRGLTKDFYLNRIDDDCAKKIRDFRKSNIPQNRQTALNRFLAYEPKKEYRDWGAQIDKLNAEVMEKPYPGTKRQKLNAAAATLKAAQAKKKPDQDAIDKAQAKFDKEQSELNSMQEELDQLRHKVEELEAQGVICSYNGGVIVGLSKLTIDQWEDEATKLCPDTGPGAAYYALCAGPSPREGTPTTVVSYDATFSYGAGFSVSTGNGWQILHDIATQPRGYDPKQQAALMEIWNFFKKCGVYIQPKNIVQTSAVAFPMDVVHIEEGPGDKVRGYAIGNSTLVKTGVHPVWGQDHSETHGAAYEAIRHSRILMQAFIAAGLTDKLPDQQNADAASAADTLAVVNFKIFCALHANTIALPKFVKRRALRIMLIHYMHWGPVFRVNTMLLWALSRQLVKARVVVKGGGAASGPMEVKGDKNVPESTDGSLDDVTDIEFTPSYETDVAFARLLGAYAMRVLPGASRGQMAGYWKDFCDDLSKHDGQAALVATLPKYFLDSVDDLKKTDPAITDAIIESDYATEKIGKTAYVLGKKRDMDEIKAFRGNGEKKLNTLISMLNAKKN